MGDFEPINFNFKPVRYDYCDNVNTNRWYVVSQQTPPEPNTPVWDMPVTNLPKKKSIGELLGTKQTAKAVKPENTTVTETAEQTPPEDQTSQAEKDRIAEEKMIKSFSALANAKLLSDEAKINFIKETSAYIKMLGENATYDDSYTDHLGNYHSLGMTENGNKIELITGKGPEDSAIKRIKITTDDGTSLILVELSNEKIDMVGISSKSNGEDNNVTASGMSYRRDLENNCISKVEVNNIYRDIDGNLHTNTTTQTYNPDGSAGYAFFEESTSDNLGNAGGHTFIGTIDENGNFAPITQNPNSSWERTNSTYTGYDGDGNITVQEELPQPQSQEGFIQQDAPLETIDEPASDPTQRTHRTHSTNNQSANIEIENNGDTSELDYPEETLSEIPIDADYVFEGSPTNMLLDVEGAIKKQ